MNRKLIFVKAKTNSFIFIFLFVKISWLLFQLEKHNFDFCNSETWFNFPRVTITAIYGNVKTFLLLLSTRKFLIDTYWYLPLIWGDVCGGGVINVNFMFWIGLTHTWKHNATKSCFNFLYTSCNLIWGLTPNNIKSNAHVWDHVWWSWY